MNSSNYRNIMALLPCAAIAGLLILGSLTSVLAQDSTTKYFAEITDRVDENYDYLRDLYFQLHSNPEISWQEVETSQRLAGILERLNFDVTRGVGKSVWSGCSAMAMDRR